MTTFRPRHLITALAMGASLLGGTGLASSNHVAAQAATGPTTITIEKKTCDGSQGLPLYGESNCEPSANQTFTLTGENGTSLDADFTSGAPIEVSDPLGMWTVTSAEGDQGVSVLSCEALLPDSDAVVGVAATEMAPQGGQSLTWHEITHQSDAGTFTPSLSCTYFDILNLPEGATPPTVLSLEAQYGDAFLDVTQTNGTPLPFRTIGEQGDDLEVPMSLTNENTGEAINFAADESGQVLVPQGTYTLTETTTGQSATGLVMDTYMTTHAHVSIPSQDATQGGNTTAQPTAADTQTDPGATDASSGELVRVDIQVEYCSGGSSGAETCEGFFEPVDLEVSINGEPATIITTQETSVGYRATIEVPADAFITVKPISTVAEVTGQPVEIAVSDIALGGAGGESTVPLITVQLLAP